MLSRIFFGSLLFCVGATAATVLSKVQCKVKNPKTLHDMMGFEIGQRISLASLDDQTSDLDRNGDYCVTSFPAVLNFEGDGFALSRTGATPLSSSMELRMQGFLGNAALASLSIQYRDSDGQNIWGSADLDDCQRIH